MDPPWRYAKTSSNEIRIVFMKIDKRFIRLFLKYWFCQGKADIKHVHLQVCSNQILHGKSVWNSNERIVSSPWWWIVLLSCIVLHPLVSKINVESEQNTRIRLNLYVGWKTNMYISDTCQQNVNNFTFVLEIRLF